MLRPLRPSKGLVDDATTKARAMARNLAEQTPEGSPIVGCEPSCLFTCGTST